LLTLASGLAAAPLRIASFNVSLGRKGPGLLLRDIERGKDAQIRAVEAIIAEVNPDVLILNGFDHDFGGAALAAFAQHLAQRGASYPFRFALRPNTGLRTGLDLDGDGKTGMPGDAQGYGRFSGARGMAVLSRLPVLQGSARDYSARLWRDFPGALMPRRPDGSPFPSARAWAVQRLSTTAHWSVPLRLRDGRILRLLLANPTPPVFDGPEDRNGRRNHDEVSFLSRLISKGQVTQPFVIAGDLNIDPRDGAGLKDAIRDILANPALRDPRPTSKGARVAARQQAGANTRHLTPAKMDTVDWRDRPGPGNMRVDYVLPSADLGISDTGVFWPAPGEKGADLLATATRHGTRHRLVWVDIKRAGNITGKGADP